LKIKIILKIIKRKTSLRKQR